MSDIITAMANVALALNLPLLDSEYVRTVRIDGFVTHQITVKKTGDAEFWVEARIFDSRSGFYSGQCVEGRHFAIDDIEAAIEFGQSQLHWLWQPKAHQMLVAGKLCGIQSVIKESANVFMNDEANTSHYVRIDRINNLAIQPDRMNPAYEFVQANIAAFEQKCIELS